jgi:hypothetical protein
VNAANARNADCGSAVPQICDLPAAHCIAMLFSRVRHPHVPNVSDDSSQRDEKQLAQGCEERATLGGSIAKRSTLKGLKHLCFRTHVDRTQSLQPFQGCGSTAFGSQGSSSLTTLGYGTESIQDSKSQHRVDPVFSESIESRVQNGGGNALWCRRTMRLASHSNPIKARAR